jgi:hypothetical protein
MTNFKGTKGKWSITDGLPNGQDIQALRIQSDPEEWDIAAVWDDIPSEDAKANALLISKAPEMLEMLEELLQYGANHGMPFDLYEKTQQLIKEATEL